MASDDGERTRFPCLATVRSLVATVVTVLTVVVVVMVIVVVHRPEDISLSISGYILSEQLWWTEKTRSSTDPVVAQAQRPLIPPEIGDDTPSVETDTVYGGPQVITTYAPAPPPVTLRFTWSAHNPSGRGGIECNITAIRVVDMPNASSTGMEIGSIFFRHEPLRFSVPRQASHTNTHWVTINDTTTLQYIYDQYEGKSSFKAMVQVNATVTSKAPLSSPTGHSVNHYCWPVTVVYGMPDDAAYGGVTCKMEYPAPVYSQPLAPSPAPTGVAG